MPEHRAAAQLWPFRTEGYVLLFRAVGSAQAAARVVE